MAEPAVSVPTSATEPPGEFRAGHVLSSSLSILFRNIPQFGVLSAVASLPYLFFLIDGKFGTFGQAQRIGTRAYYLELLIDTILTAFCQSIVLFGAFQAMRGRPFRIGESLSKGLARFIPVLGTSVLSAVVTGFATLLLIVPGLMLMSAFYVALPVCVVERLGPVDSLSRSGELTKGFRWKVFGLAILLLIAIGIVTSVVGVVSAPLRGSLVMAIGLYLLETLSRAILAVVAVVAYHDLRVAKEGVDIEHIASVFD